MRELTKLQRQAMYSLEGYAGKTVEVATSQYALRPRVDGLGNSSIGCGWSPVAFVPFQVLKALENKRLVEIVNKYWRGADVKIICPAAKCKCGVEWGRDRVLVSSWNTEFKVYTCPKCKPNYVGCCLEVSQ